MRKLPFLVGLLPIIALAVGVAGCAGGEEPTLSPTAALPSTYENTEHAIRIEYPEDWTKEEGLMGAVVFFSSPLESASDDFQENLNIAVEDLSAMPMTLGEYTELSIKQVEQLVTDYDTVESRTTTLANNPAYELVFTGRQGLYDLKWMVVWTLEGNKAYMITYTAEAGKYSDYLGSIRQMIGSFDIIQEPV